MTVTKIKRYKKAHILILNEWQTFIYIIFYKGKFYANTFQITKRGEYTNREFKQAMDGALIAAKTTVDVIRERSLIKRLLQWRKQHSQHIEKETREPEGKQPKSRPSTEQRAT